MTKKIYRTAQDHIKNLTQLAEIFDLNRDTIRKRIRYGGVRPYAKEKGVNMYILRDAAEAIVAYEIIQKPKKYSYVLNS